MTTYALRIDVEMGYLGDDPDERDRVLDAVSDALSSVEAEAALGEAIGESSGYEPEAVQVLEVREAGR